MVSDRIEMQETRWQAVTARLLAELEEEVIRAILRVLPRRRIHYKVHIHPLPAPTTTTAGGQVDSSQDSDHHDQHGEETAGEAQGP